MGAQYGGAIPENFRKAFNERFWDGFYKLDGWLAKKQTQFRDSSRPAGQEWLSSCQKILRPSLENSWRLSAGLSRGIVAPVSAEAKSEHLTSGMEKCVDKCLSDELAELISLKIQTVGAGGDKNEALKFWQNLKNNEEFRGVLDKHGVCLTNKERSVSHLSINKLEALLSGVIEGIEKGSSFFSRKIPTEGDQTTLSKPVLLNPRYSDYYPTDKHVRAATHNPREVSSNPPSMSVVALWPPRQLRDNQESKACQTSFPKYGLHFIRKDTCFASYGAANQKDSTTNNSMFSGKVDKVTQVNFPLISHIMKVKTRFITPQNVEYIPLALANPCHRERRWESSIKIVPRQEETSRVDMRSDHFARNSMTCTWTHRKHTPIWRGPSRSPRFRFC